MKISLSCIVNSFTSRIKQSVSSVIEVGGFSFLTALSLTIGGTGTALSLISLRKVSFLNNCSKFLKMTPNITGIVYKNALYILNPNLNEQLGRGGEGKYNDTSASTCYKTCEAFYKFSQQLAKEPSSSGIHLRARIFSLTCIPLALLTRIVDFVLGVFAALYGCLSIGSNKEVNEYAIKHLPLHFFFIDAFSMLTSALYPYDEQ
jgi:hypothetical protein